MTALPHSSPLSDWELWACAKQQIDQHGEVAATMAALRADRLLDEGDMVGHRTWLEILARIKQLQAPQPGESRH